MRLAFVTPLPPAPTGVADYACDVLELLSAGADDAAAARRGAATWTVDVFHAQQHVERARLPAACGLFAASELRARQAARPYDLVVYQLGNSLAHAFVYDLLPRLPGLVVLHDLVLHHARARQFLESPAALAYAADPARAELRAAALTVLRDYRDELTYTYPRQAARLYDAQLESVGRLLPYAYPLCRLPLECARAALVHNDALAAAVRDEVPELAVLRAPMPVVAAPVAAGDVRALRARLGLQDDDFAVGAFGLQSAEKRIETLARAVARAGTALPRLRLLLVGPVPGDESGQAALRARLHALGVGERTRVTGRVPWAELPLYMAAADVAVHLRYPTARETSAALLRLLAQGRPVVMSDLTHQADVPADAALRVDVSDEEGEVTRAIMRLAERPALRASLGQRAAAFVAREHAPALARAGYLAAIEAALRQPPPAPRPDWPAHWRAAAADR